MVNKLNLLRIILTLSHWLKGRPCPIRWRLFDVYTLWIIFLLTWPLLICKTILALNSFTKWFGIGVLYLYIIKKLNTENNGWKKCNDLNYVINMSKQQIMSIHNEA